MCLCKWLKNSVLLCFLNVWMFAPTESPTLLKFTPWWFLLRGHVCARINKCNLPKRVTVLHSFKFWRSAQAIRIIDGKLNLSSSALAIKWDLDVMTSTLYTPLANHNLSKCIVRSNRIHLHKSWVNLVFARESPPPFTQCFSLSPSWHWLPCWALGGYLARLFFFMFVAHVIHKTCTNEENINL